MYDVANLTALTKDHQAFIDDASERKVLIGSVAAGKTAACIMSLHKHYPYADEFNLLSLRKGGPYRQTQQHRLTYINAYTPFDVNLDETTPTFLDGLTAATSVELLDSVKGRNQVVTCGNYELLPHKEELEELGFSVHILPPMTDETAKHLPANYIEKWLSHHPSSEHFKMTG